MKIVVAVVASERYVGTLGATGTLVGCTYVVADKVVGSRVATAGGCTALAC